MTKGDLVYEGRQTNKVLKLIEERLGDSVEARLLMLARQDLQTWLDILSLENFD